MTAPRLFALLLLGLLAARLCHVGILWEGGSLPLAAAVQMLDGKTLYRDVWYDKPPLAPAVCLLWGARAGWPLRLAGTLFVLLACYLLYRFARELWSEREGMLAAALLAFFLTFGIPAAVIPLAPDLLMVVPHIAAVYLAWRRRPFWSGLAAGVALLVNTKAVFVLGACLLWGRPLACLAGFAVPVAAAAAWLAAQGSLGAWYRQVWQLGALYARHTFLEHPVREGLIRTLNWAGFHAALILAAAWFWRQDRAAPRLRLAAWTLLSLAAVTAGWRFFPRYYLALLPVMTLAAARGIRLMGRWRAVVLLALLVPLARFGPRYVLLAQDLFAGREHAWRDVVMGQDSRAAARLVLEQARPGDTLFVWGYRPDIFVYTRMPAATRFLESQPLTGVFADRHLSQSGSVADELARKNRQELIRHRPTFVLDGLSAFNPKLAMETYAELRPWLADYRVVGRTRFTVIYRSSTPAASGEKPPSPPAHPRPARSAS
ncbi:MAG: glycosyltransferase family 39 protein [Acidobacteriota bacterium]